MRLYLNIFFLYIFILSFQACLTQTVKEKSPKWESCRMSEYPCLELSALKRGFGERTGQYINIVYQSIKNNSQGSSSSGLCKADDTVLDTEFLSPCLWQVQPPLTSPSCHGRKPRTPFPGISFCCLVVAFLWPKLAR